MFNPEYQETYRKCSICGRIYEDNNCITEPVCPICKIEPQIKETFTVKWNELPDIIE